MRRSCRFLIPCAAVAVVAAAPAAAASLHAMPVVDAGRVAAALDDVRPRAAAACKTGVCHAARRDPVPAVPAPSVLALLGAGLALLGWHRPQAWGFTRLAPRCPG